MNYIEMSDFEINKAVAIACGYAEENCEFGWQGKPDVGVEWSDETGYPTKSFNYCNSWADAGPIIGGARIAIMPSEMKSELQWISTSGRGQYQYHPNPLRAAMIVFLKMRDAGNA